MPSSSPYACIAIGCTWTRSMGGRRRRDSPAVSFSRGFPMAVGPLRRGFLAVERFQQGDTQLHRQKSGTKPRASLNALVDRWWRRRRLSRCARLQASGSSIYTPTPSPPLASRSSNGTCCGLILPPPSPLRILGEGRRGWLATAACAAARPTGGVWNALVRRYRGSCRRAFCGTPLRLRVLSSSYLSWYSHET